MRDAAAPSTGRVLRNRAAAARYARDGADAGSRSECAGDAEAARCERGSDRRARAELWRAGSKTGRDPRSEDAEAEQRQRSENQGQRIIERRRITAVLCELREQRRADADDNGEDQDLDARRDDRAESLFGEKSRLVEQAERHEHEARQGCQLEFDEGDEELYGQNEEGDDDDEKICTKFSKNET
jgi:hypothetical protein